MTRSVGGLNPALPSLYGRTVNDQSEFDRELLERLRQRHPDKGDRELLESMAKMTLGRESLRRVQERSSLSEDEAIALGVKAVHEARRKRRTVA